MLFAEKKTEERLHSGAGKEGRRVVLKNERGGRNDLMTLRFLKLKIFLSNFASIHTGNYNIFLRGFGDFREPL